MSSRELPEDVCALIRTSVPTIDALELLLELVRDPARSWNAAELSGNGHAVVPEATVARLLDEWRAQGLLVERESGRYSYQARTAELAGAVAGLMQAYEERPVTLIRTIYAIADSKIIQSFADAFRLKRGKES